MVAVRLCREPLAYCRNKLFDKAYYARELVGIRFQHQGRTRHGMDCVGVIADVCDNLRIPYSDPRNYGRCNNGTTLVRYVLESFIACEEFEADICLLKRRNKAEHIAIWLGQSIVHAHAQAGKVVEQPVDHEIRPLIHSFWRFKK